MKFYILFLGLIFLHFNLTTVGTFPVTIGTIACLYVFLVLSTKARFNVELKYILIFFVFFVFQSVLLILKQSGSLLAFLQCVFTLFFILLCFLKNDWFLNDFSPKKIKRAINFISCIIVIGVTAQFLMLNLLNSYALQNPFGPFSHIGPGGVYFEPHPEAVFKRTNFVFYEPSVLGWMIGLVLSFRLFVFRTFDLLSILLSLVVIFSGSLSGGLAVLGVIAAYFYIHQKNKILVFISILALLSTSAFLMLEYGVVEKLYLITEPGTSTYYRIFAPVLLIFDSYSQGFFFGHALGDTSFIETRWYMINTDGGSSTNIDNSFFYLSYYFGLIGVVFSVSFMIFTLKKVVENSYISLMLVALFFCLAATGAIFSPSLCFIYFLIFLLAKNHEKFEYNNRRL